MPIDAIALSELHDWTARYGRHGTILTAPDGEEYWAVAEVLAFVAGRPIPGDTPDKYFYEVLPEPDVRIRSEPKRPDRRVKFWKASAIRAWLGAAR